MTSAEDILKAIDSMEVIDSGSSNLIAAMCDEVRLVESKHQIMHTYESKEELDILIGRRHLSGNTGDHGSNSSRASESPISIFGCFSNK